jgi:hypothetical protein
MSKNQNLDTGGQLTQNQNNAMSNDPADGSRNSFTARGEGGGAEPAPDEQSKDLIEEFGRRGVKPKKVTSSS